MNIFSVLLVLGTLSSLLTNVNGQQFSPHGMKGYKKTAKAKKMANANRLKYGAQKNYKQGHAKKEPLGDVGKKGASPNNRGSNLTSFDDSIHLTISDTNSYHPELYCPNSITYSN